MRLKATSVDSLTGMVRVIHVDVIRPVPKWFTSVVGAALNKRLKWNLLSTLVEILKQNVQLHLTEFKKCVACKSI